MPTVVAVQPIVDAALEQMARKKEIDAEDAEYLSFEERMSFFMILQMKSVIPISILI